ncbi:MAG: rod shape-determining protein, partial [Planctomycetota bacterium]
MSNIQADATSDDAGVKKDHGVLYLGIDLGTSRTSVSSSNGIRETIESFVGYPKDPVAQKLLKKDVLFGQEAREKRLSLNLHRPLEHGVLKFNADGSEDGESRRAAMDLVKEIVRLSRPRKDELVYAVIGVPAQAQINNKDAILQAARESVDSVMLCSEPFSVAYGLDMLEDVLVIDIGAGTVDLCRMHGTMPEESDQITMNTAGDFVDDELSKEISGAYPDAQFTKQMIKSIKERYSTVDATT